MYNIAVIYGDGVGKEIIKEAIRVLEKISSVFDIEFTFNRYLAGGEAIDECGLPLPSETIEGCKNADAVLLGSVGGPKWDNVPSDKRPERAILGLRKELELFINIRPIKLFAELESACPIKTEITNSNIDFIIVRELTGGVYFGEKGRGENNGVAYAYDTEKYDENEIARAVKAGFEMAMLRDKKVTIVDKANVLESSKLWREVTNKVHEDYPQIELDYLYVDNAVMQIILKPSSFDVIITSNIFGDIISDEASVLCGSIGLAPSASLGNNSTLGLYEPIHGSAPDIMGKNIANPIGTILSAAMMLRYSLKEHEAASAIENAVALAIKEGARTADIASSGSQNKVGTSEMADIIISHIKK